MRFLVIDKEITVELLEAKVFIHNSIILNILLFILCSEIWFVTLDLNWFNEFYYIVSNSLPMPIWENKKLLGILYKCPYLFKLSVTYTQLVFYVLQF